MIGNHLGGAYFGHSAGGGHVSALRWFGGSLEDNGGAGLFLGNGARNIIDGVTVADNNGYGISAEWGITSVTDSEVRDNRVDGIWFQNFGYFNNNTFTSSGVHDRPPPPSSLGGRGTDHMWGDGRIVNGVPAPNAVTGAVITGADHFIFAPGNGNDDINDFRRAITTRSTSGLWIPRHRRHGDHRHGCRHQDRF